LSRTTFEHDQAPQVEYLRGLSFVCRARLSAESLQYFEFETSLNLI